MVLLTYASVLALIIPGLLLGVFAFVGVCGTSHHFLTQDAFSAFECGFDPFSTSRMPFSLRFFLIAVVFLIFDVEIALLLPLPIALQLSVRVGMVVGVVLFLVLLTGGLFLEWWGGALEWAH